MLLLALATASAAPIDTAVSGAAGFYAGQPGAGLELEATSGSDAALQLRGSLGAFGRVRAWPAIANTFYPLVATADLELAVGRPVGRYSRLGPALALDTLILHGAEQNCGGNPCRRFATFLGRSDGPGITGALAVGGRWSRHTEHTLELGFALEPVWMYDRGLIVPRTDLDWTRPDGWRIGAEVDRHEIAIELGHSLR